MRMEALDLSILWIIAAVAVLFYPVMFIIYFLLSLLVDPRKQYETDSRFFRFLLYSGTRLGLCLLRVKVKITGIEKIPQDRRFLLVSNHISCYDPIVTWHALRRYDLSFISKPSNFKVPIFGRLIHRCLFLPIDREDPRKAMATVNRAASFLKDGKVSVAIYPEGKRNKEGHLLPFHNGVLRIAQKAKVPIVVLAVRGTDTVYRRVLRKRTTVYLDVLNVLEPESFAGQRCDAIGEEIYRELEHYLEGEKNHDLLHTL